MQLTKKAHDIDKKPWNKNNCL